MVLINRRRGAGGGSGTFGTFVTSSIAGFVFICAIVILVVVNNSRDLQSVSMSDITSAISSATSGGYLGDPNFSEHENAERIKAWRKNIRDKCVTAKTATDVTAVSSINKVGFELPSYQHKQPRGDGAVKRCRHVVMDFGANIGDTSGHVIDSGMLGCDRSRDLKAKTSEVHFNVETKQFEETKKRNPLTQHLIKMMKAEGALIGPEDYCYYGVEGNPVFTERLQAIEDYVMAMRPRPIQHMHFFTESVGAGEDGMTKLYLDTINKDVNFWGSSIFKDHQDVRKSNANATSGSAPVAADVMGRTIGSLMRQTLRAYAPDATEEEKKGNHLVLKVDIEGGEYPLLFQAKDEGTLCDFVKMGNKADLFIEFHSQRVTGKHGYAGKVAGMKDHLTKCGVTFRNLAAWWA